MHSLKNLTAIVCLVTHFGYFAAQEKAVVANPRSILGLQFPSPARSGPDQRLTNDPGASLLSYNFARSIAADDAGRVHVVWYDNRSGQSQIYYKRSADGGFTWEPDLRLTPDQAQQEHPAIATSGKAIHIVWHDARNGGFNIYLKRSTDGGASWEPDVRLSTSSSAAHASIAASGSNVHVIWGDHRDGEQAEIYTRASPDGGESWGEEMRLSELPYDS